MKDFIKEYKIALMLSFVALMAIFISACNMQPIDLTFSYDYGYISLPTGEVIEGKVDSWRDFDDGDQLQVVIDGDTYLTNSVNVVLVKKGH